jgi:hypothetical protein
MRDIALGFTEKKMSRYRHINVNPQHKRNGDCTVRAISVALNQSWEKTFVGLCLQGFCEFDMPSGNAIWGAYLRDKGFTRGVIPTDCPVCYTVEDFCIEHPKGTYVLGTGTHAICAKDGFFYDSWNSGGETPIYYYKKRED